MGSRRAAGNRRAGIIEGGPGAVNLKCVLRGSHLRREVVASGSRRYTASHRSDEDRAMLSSIDINCDMGESFGNWQMGNDAGMMPLITTANVACGFHAGDPLTLLNTCQMAGAHKVVVGSHPGLPDLMGFGRRAMNISPEDAYAYVVYRCRRRCACTA